MGYVCCLECKSTPHKFPRLLDNDPLHEDHTEVQTPSNTDKVDLRAMFQRELITARNKLTESNKTHRSCRSSIGHRAGFDAFMTGYTFGCYALQSGAQSGEVSLEGLNEQRNCLASRPGNKKVPLHILKSHFTKTSATHKLGMERMNLLKSTLNL